MRTLLLRRSLAAASLALFASACASGNFVRTGEASAQGEAATGFRAPQVMHGRGIDAVIGQQAPALTQRFGSPRLDLTEGDARKLQFVGDACVLDIFLYPLEAGGTQVATHVEARQRRGGGEVDRASCIDAVDRANG